MRDHLLEQSSEKLKVVGSARLEAKAVDIASAMREDLKLNKDWASAKQNWSVALGELCERAENSGILVVANGIVCAGFKYLHRSFQTLLCI